MRKSHPRRSAAILALALLLVAPTVTQATPGRSSSSSSSSSQPVEQAPTGGGGEGFAATPKAVSAWEAAGGRKGTGLSFQDWSRKQRSEFEARQEKLTWEAKKAGWGASAMNVPVWGAMTANYLGKASQFGLSFVPGVGKLTNIGLDAARGAAEGYSDALDKGLSQSEARKVGGTTGLASGVFSAFTSKLGFGKDAGKALNKVKTAKTAAQLTKSRKQLGKALISTTTDEGAKEVVGGIHSDNVVKNTSPQARLIKD